MIFFLEWRSFIRIFFGIIFILIQIGCSQLRASSSAHFVIECSIYDQNMQILKKYPGSMCLFLEDGSYISVFLEDHISKWSPEGNLVWTRNIPLHHQMNFDKNKNKLLVLYSENVKSGQKVDRYEGIMALDIKSGQTLGNYSIYQEWKSSQKFFKEAKRKCDSKIHNHDESDSNSCSISHLNAVYEIPPNINEVIGGAFKSGNVVVTNGYARNILILDSNLNKILRKIDLPGVESPVHDAQVLENGKILYYLNRNSDPRLGPAAEIRTFDVSTKENPTIYPQSESLWKSLDLNLAEFIVNLKSKNSFYSRLYSDEQGSVQQIGQNYLMSVNDPRLGNLALMVSESGVLLWAKILTAADRNSESWKFQQVKQYDLSSFLRKNRM